MPDNPGGFGSRFNLLRADVLSREPLFYRSV
jgi:hypothetical protein